MKTKTHKHEFLKGLSGKVETCACGAFHHINLKPEDVITEIPAIQHTPTPWEQKSQSNGQAQIYGENGKTIAITYYNDEDAALIVRAVNSHEALLEAAKEALCTLDPDCVFDGEKVSSSSSDRSKMIIALYEAINQAEAR